jgi:hypothetical protein
MGGTENQSWLVVLCGQGPGRRKNCCSRSDPSASSGISTLPWRRDFKIRGKFIRAVKYPDELMLLAKEETVLQGMIGGLV